MKFCDFSVKVLRRITQAGDFAAFKDPGPAVSNDRGYTCHFLANLTTSGFTFRNIVFFLLGTGFNFCTSLEIWLMDVFVQSIGLHHPYWAPIFQFGYFL